MNEYGYYTGREDGRSFWDYRPGEDDSYERESWLTEGFEPDKGKQEMTNRELNVLKKALTYMRHDNTCNVSVNGLCDCGYWKTKADFEDVIAEIRTKRDYAGEADDANGTD